MYLEATAAVLAGFVALVAMMQSYPSQSFCVASIRGGSQPQQALSPKPPIVLKDMLLHD
jgi:hypothetical protein